MTCFLLNLVLVLMGILVTGQHIHTKKDSVVTFSGTAADNVVKLLSNSCKCKDPNRRKCKTKRPSDCGELDKKTCPSGVYTIFPGDTSEIDVFCEMLLDGGGWTVIQRRRDGSVNFYRNWATYKAGFGSFNGEFWLGNDHIHQITSQASYTLRIDMKDFENNKRYAKYSKFSVGDESSGYMLHVTGYQGNAGDGIKKYQSGRKFSTKDTDNDESPNSCSHQYKGAWWYGNCHCSNLNGLYLSGNHSSFADGVNWCQWKGYHYSLKSTTMMIRRG